MLKCDPSSNHSAMRSATTCQSAIHQTTTVRCDPPPTVEIAIHQSWRKTCSIPINQTNKQAITKCCDLSPHVRSRSITRIQRRHNVRCDVSRRHVAIAMNQTNKRRYKEGRREREELTEEGKTQENRNTIGGELKMKRSVRARGETAAKGDGRKRAIAP
jgi:hypothetical protein